MENYNADKSSSVYGDEIDLIELFSALWRTRYIALAAVCLVTVLYFAFTLAHSILRAGDVTYGSIIKLTFTGVRQAQYPNGSVFSYQDLIAPNIVAAMHEKHNLDNMDVSLDEFRSMLLVEPYSPQYPLIVEKYEKQLSQKGLSIEKIEALQEKLRLELDQAMYGSALISMRTPAGIFSPDQVKSILTDIPAYWAEAAIVDKGVLQLDIKLASAKSLDDELLHQIDYMVLGDILNDKVAQIENNINTLAEIDGAATITDPVTGLRLADLTEALTDSRKYVIDELMSPIRSLGLTRNKELSIYYYADKKKSYNRDLALYEHQSQLVREAITVYQSSTTAAPTDLTSGQAPSINGAGSAAQMTADAIDKISAMAGQVKAEEYKQALNEQWLTLKMQAAETRAKIRETDDFIAALKGTGQTSLEVGFKEEYLARAETMLPLIIERLRSYFDITQRIHKQLNAETNGATGLIYQPASSELFVNKQRLSSRMFIIWAVLVLLTLFIVVPVTMLRNAMRARTEAQILSGSVLRKITKPKSSKKQTAI